MRGMGAKLLEVVCPCCEATLKVDPDTSAVISHKEKEKPHVVEDISEAVQRLKKEAARREEVFQKQLDAQKTHKEVLAKKFDELFKQAKESSDKGPFKKDIDLD
jgi:predicted nuclease with TOPRIM domain